MVVFQFKQISHTKNRVFAKCASNNKFIKGVVGWVDLCSPDLEKKLKSTVQQKIKGVRHIVQSEIKNIYSEGCQAEYQNYPISTLL